MFQLLSISVFLLSCAFNNMWTVSFQDTVPNWEANVFHAFKLIFSCGVCWHSLTCCFRDRDCTLRFSACDTDSTSYLCCQTNLHVTPGQHKWTKLFLLLRRDNTPFLFPPGSVVPEGLACSPSASHFLMCFSDVCPCPCLYICLPYLSLFPSSPFLHIKVVFGSFFHLKYCQPHSYVHICYFLFKVANDWNQMTVSFGTTSHWKWHFLFFLFFVHAMIFLLFPVKDGSSIKNGTLSCKRLPISALTRKS